MFASSSRGGPAPAGRGGAGGPAGKYSVDELYGLPKKSKLVRGESVRRRSQVSQGAPAGREGPPLTPAQVLEAARRLLERRRLECYLLEAGIAAEELESGRTGMVYRYQAPRAGRPVQRPARRAGGVGWGGNLSFKFLALMVAGVWAQRVLERNHRGRCFRGAKVKGFWDPLSVFFPEFLLALP